MALSRDKTSRTVVFLVLAFAASLFKPLSSAREFEGMGLKGLCTKIYQSHSYWGFDFFSFKSMCRAPVNPLSATISIGFVA